MLERNNMNVTILKNISKLISKTLNGNGDSDQHLMTLFSIALQIKAKKILELGVRDGVTSLPFLLATSCFNGTLTSVDISQTSYTPPEKLIKFYNFIQIDSLTFLNNCINNNIIFDLIFVDDDHDYLHVKQELELITKIINNNTIVILHDLMAEGCEPKYRYGIRPGFADGGPYRAVNELNPTEFEWSTIPVNNGLTILRKKCKETA